MCREICTAVGLKGANAAQLLGAMEVARRMAVPTKRGNLQLTGTAAAADYLKERLRELADEQFRVLYLNRRHALLEDALIPCAASRGRFPPGPPRGPGFRCTCALLPTLDDLNVAIIYR